MPEDRVVDGNTFHAYSTAATRASLKRLSLDGESMTDNDHALENPRITRPPC